MEPSAITIEEPFPLYALPRVWKWIESFRQKVFDDFGPKTEDQFIEYWVSRQFRSWAVLRHGVLGGVITSTNITPRVAEMHCIFREEFWGHENTVPPICAVADILIETGITKVTSCVTPDNHGIVALLKKIGGVREGHLRGQQLRGGKPSDLIIMAVHKEAYLARNQRASDATDHAGTGAGSNHPGNRPKLLRREAHDEPLADSDTGPEKEKGSPRRDTGPVQFVEPARRGRRSAHEPFPAASRADGNGAGSPSQ